MPKIFVYGTLKSGYHNNYLLRQANAELVEPAKVVSGFEIWQRGIPYMVPVPEQPEKQVTGEVWDVSHLGLQWLDRLEGHPDWYTRTVIDENAEIEAYLMTHHTIPQDAVLNDTGVY